MDYKKGYEEDSFLLRLEVEPADLEFLAENCTKVFNKCPLNLSVLAELALDLRALDQLPLDIFALDIYVRHFC